MPWVWAPGYARWLLIRRSSRDPDARAYYLAFAPASASLAELFRLRFWRHTILHIVPNQSVLAVDAAIEPQSINQVWRGQTARLRFSAFNARPPPEIDGVLTRVSADVLVNEATGQSFHTAEIAISEDGLAALEGLTLVAGMPVEVFLQTGERAPMSYLLRPFTDFVSRAMRED